MKNVFEDLGNNTNEKSLRGFSAKQHELIIKGMSTNEDRLKFEPNAKNEFMNKLKYDENSPDAVDEKLLLTPSGDAAGESNDFTSFESKEALRSHTNGVERIFGKLSSFTDDATRSPKEKNERMESSTKEQSRKEELGLFQTLHIDSLNVDPSSSQVVSSIDGRDLQNTVTQKNTEFNLSSMQQTIMLAVFPNPDQSVLRQQPNIETIQSQESTIDISSKAYEDYSQDSSNSFDENCDIVESLLDASRSPNPMISFLENDTTTMSSQTKDGRRQIDEEPHDTLGEGTRANEDLKTRSEVSNVSMEPDSSESVKQEYAMLKYNDRTIVEDTKNRSFDDYSIHSQNDESNEKDQDDGIGNDDASHKNTSTVPQHVEYHSGFEIEDKILPDWREDGLANSNDFNYKDCYGIIHVRILRTQRLSCPVNSDVHAIVALPPWTGRIRSKATKAFSGPDLSLGSEDGEKNLLGNATHSGVCAVWDEDRVPPLSMVHDAMSSDADTAQMIPSIKLELVFCPLGISFVELSMCSLTVSCRRLLQNPNVSIRQWFLADSSSDLNTSKASQTQKKLQTHEKQETETEPLISKSSSYDDSMSIPSIHIDDSNDSHHSLSYRFPIIEIEAMFEPIDLSSSKDEVRDSPNLLDVDNGVQAYTKEKTSEQDNFISASRQNDSYSINADENASYATKLSLAEHRFLRTPLSPKRSMNVRGSASFSGDTGSVSTQSFSKIETSKKQHLFRTITYWTPAICCVCKKNIMIGLWSSKAFHCEECNIDCCIDCRLHVDIQLPCGSAAAAQARNDSIQSKLTVENIMSVVAPVVGVDPKSIEQHSQRITANVNEFLSVPSESDLTPLAKNISSSDEIVRPNSDNLKNLNIGVGVMKLNFIRAHVLKNAMPLETEPTEIVNLDGENAAKFRPGDYYIRVTWTGSDKSARTQTVQSSGGRPKFRANEMRFTAKDYGTVFRIEVVDASTDKPLGSSIITTQGILQQQRDYLIEEKGMPYLYFLAQGPLKFTKLRRLAIEIRAGLNDFEFYNPPKPQLTISNDLKAHPGDVVGCVEALVGFEEDLDSLYGQNPYSCPARPGDELNMALFQVHLSRVTSLLDDLKTTIDMFQFVVSWKNPLLTTVSLYFFLHLVFVFDPIYIGSFPVFLGILWMIYLAISRSYGKLNQKFIQKEIEASRKTQNITVDYSIHRPIGLIRVSVVSGKNMRSPELGLPGNVGCRVYWDPTRYTSTKKKEKIITLDKASRSTHDIGTSFYVYSVNPEWDQIIPSIGMKRLRQVFPRDGIFFDSAAGDSLKEIDFPVLQPFKKVNDEVFSLEPWTKSGGGIVIEVKFNDVLSVIPGSEYCMGEVSIPFVDIVKRGNVSGWYPVIDNDSGLFASSSQSIRQNKNEGTDSESSIPQVFLKLAWIPPASKTDTEWETEKEASHVIQEEMVKSALLNQQQKLSIVGTSIGAFNTVRGLSGNLLLVQNTLGAFLDIIEQFVQVWNFTDPFKSSVVLGILIVVWVVLSVVPTRVILLVAGLSQYVISFMARFQNPVPKPIKSEPDNAQVSPLVLWLLNGFRGLPTNEDLRKTYFWDCRRVKARETESCISKKRQHRMAHLWRVDWHGHVELLKSGMGRQTVFALLQGHRFLWWRSANDFDEGGDPAGYLSLRGHAGLATPSPLEIRELKPDDLACIVCIFGRGVDKQERLTMLTKSIDAKIDLEKIVEDSLAKKEN